MNKAFTFPRILAYLIDAIIIGTLISLVVMCLPTEKKVTELQKELTEVQQSYLNKNIEESEYIEKTKDISYKLDYQNVPATVISITLYVLYFVVLQKYNNGQTLGKKFMKIKIISNNESELTLNNYLYRTLLLNGLLINIINLCLVLFLDKNSYFFVSLSLQLLQIVLLLVTMFMVLFKQDGRGLHDMVANTKVVMED